LAGGKAGHVDWLVYGGDREEQRTDVKVVGWRKIGELVETVD